MAKKKTDAELLEEYIAELKKDYDRWEYILENGTSDPFWSDGANINLVRTHTLIGHKKIQELCEKAGIPLPDVSQREIPPEMPNDFYAKRDLIILKGKEIIEKVQQKYNPSEYEKDSLLVKCFNGLKSSLERDNLSYLRHRTFEDYQEYAEKSAKKLHDYAETSQGQLGLLKSAPPVKPARKVENTVVNQSQKLNELYSGYLSNLKVNWLSFLNVASNLYQHNFINQVLIYGQNKDVTDVKTEKEWNTSERFLNFGTVPIKVIMRKSDTLVEQRLYDISQTYGYEETAEKVEPPTKQELVTVLQSLENKYGIMDKSNPINVIKTVVQKEYEEVSISTEIKTQERFIKNSVYFLVCKRLSLIQSLSSATKFDEAKGLDEKSLTAVGKIINNISVKLLKPIENNIEEIRRDNHYGQKDNQRGNLFTVASRSIGEHGERNAIYATNDRARLGNPRTTDGAYSSNGQLSFGTLRQNTDEIHGGILQRQTGRADAGGNSDGETPPKRASADGNETQPYRTTGEEKPTTENGRLHSDSTAHGLDTDTSGGNGERGTISANLTAYTVGGFSYGSPKEKFRANITAITLLKEIEADNRQATSDEQNILSKYLGWGGLSKAFDDHATDWQEEYAELKELLTDSEYELARATTTTAFYTPPEVVSAIYDGLVSLGLKDGDKILDPALGTGNFFKGLPLSLSGCKLNGVEIDELTGRIAKQLYPNANIQIRGYQDTEYQDNLFPFAVGNVPFGDYRVFDDRYNKEKFLIHDYFFAKTLDKLQPNGIMAFVTSSGTMDKKNSSFRRYMASRAELIGAVRLPDTTFKNIAGTEAVSDILFFRKREQQIVDEPDWIHLNLTNEGMPLNQYFIDNPQNLLGKLTWRSTQYGKNVPTLKPYEDIDLTTSLKEAMSKITENYHPDIIASVQPEEKEIKEKLPALSEVKNFTYTVVDGLLYFRENNEMHLQHLNTQAEKRVRGMHEIRMAVRRIINLQDKAYDQNIFKNNLEELNVSYDKFTKTYGYLSDKMNKRAFIDDSDLPLLLSMEGKDDEGKIQKAKIFYESTIRPIQKFTPTTYDDLITLSMSNKGYIDIPYMASEFNVSEVDVVLNLQGKIYLNPSMLSDALHNDLFEFVGLMRQRDTEVDDSKLWSYILKQTDGSHFFEQADEYLTGNVKQKLDYAEVFANKFPEIYNGNVKALEQVQLEPLTIDQIKYDLGSSWIDLSYVRAFMNETVHIPSYLQQNCVIKNKTRNY